MTYAGFPLKQPALFNKGWYEFCCLVVFFIKLSTLGCRILAHMPPYICKEYVGLKIGDIHGKARMVFRLSAAT